MSIFTARIASADKLFRLRLFYFSAGILFVLVAAVLRLFYWQVVKGEELASDARRQYDWGRELSAPRGNILASDGSWLSASVLQYNLIGDPAKNSESPSKIAADIVDVLYGDSSPEQKEEVDYTRSNITDLLSKKELRWVMLKNKLSANEKEKIEGLDYPFLNFEETFVRYYPEASSAAHLLGFVGKASDGHDVGYFGLEGEYDMALSGKSGYMSFERDGSGAPLLLRDSREVEAAPGVSLMTHIDKTIQLVLETKLKQGIEKYGAVSGMGIIMRPSDGAILAMSSYPSYSPSTYWDYGDEFFINPAVSSTFEPGSIFKVLIMAAGIDAGVVEPDTICTICAGPARVDKYLIETWNRQYQKDATMTDVIIHSDNVGMVFVAQRLGIENMSSYLDRFGIGKRTGIDTQGELSAPFRSKDTWSIVDQATISFGQGIAVTPIQMVRAVGAIANGGVLMTPQIVNSLVNGTWQKDIPSQESGRVISKEAADKTTYMMAQAAKNGEAKWTFLRGFKVAGKTGTAQIPIAGHYDEDKTIASFIGFAPYDDPEFVMLITLQEPSTSQWASETAAPLWYSIAKDLFAYLQVQPDLSE
jgi:cell division protein FtsI/penicillin-binding protein 2